MVSAYRYVMSTPNASVLFCLNPHMYVTDAKIETSAVWKNDFIGQRRQITDTEKRYLRQGTSYAILRTAELTACFS